MAEKQHRKTLEQYFAWNFRTFGATDLDDGNVGRIDTRKVLAETVIAVNNALRMGSYRILNRDKFNQIVFNRTGRHISFFQEGDKTLISLESE